MSHQVGAGIRAWFFGFVLYFICVFGVCVYMNEYHSLCMESANNLRELVLPSSVCISGI